MKTILVEQMNGTPLLVVFELLTALILLTVGILIIKKTMKNKQQHTLLASGLVGVITGAVMVAVLFGITNHVFNTNYGNLRAAVTESGQNLSDEQLLQLKKDGVITLDDDKIISFSDEGKGYMLTVFDASENEAAQTEEDKEREKQIKDSDF